jgi:hypothetical protein
MCCGVAAHSLNNFLDDKLVNYLNTLSEDDGYVDSDEESVSQIDDGNVFCGDVESSDESDIIVRRPPVNRISDSESDDPQTG